MNWLAVINSLTNTMHGAEAAAKATDDQARQLEAKIVSSIAASLAVALSEGLAQHEIESKEQSE